MTTQTILDLVVILLLIPTIIYAGILNRRLGALRRSREELAKIVASFNDATLRAEAGIPKLKKATTEANSILKDRVEKAQTLRDDLAFMVERAEELATRLENAVRAARNDGLTAMAPPAAAAPAYVPAAAGRSMEPPPRTLAAATLSSATMTATQAAAPSSAENDLRSALGMARAEARAPNAPRPRRGAAERSLADRSLADRSLADRALAARGHAEPSGEEPIDEERSEAERELLKALQAAR
jgi:hypothetical protein